MPYEVIKATKDTDVEGVQMGDKYKHKFFNNAFRLPDSESAQARDIKQKFGQDGPGDVLVAESRNGEQTFYLSGPVARTGVNYG